MGDITGKLCKRVLDLEEDNRRIAAVLGWTIGGVAVLAAALALWCVKTTQTISSLTEAINQIVEYINAGGI